MLNHLSQRVYQVFLQDQHLRHKSCLYLLVEDLLSLPLIQPALVIEFAPLDLAVGAHGLLEEGTQLLVHLDHVDGFQGKKGKGFDLSDLRDQLEQMLNMGGMAAMLEKLPIPGNVNAAALKGSANEQQYTRQIAIINSMTAGERRFPKCINGSRKRRIAKGAGQEIQDVNRLLKQHLQMQKMMKKLSRGGMKNILRGMPGV